MTRAGILAPLRLPAFRRLYAAQIVANAGDGLDFLAIVTIIVYQWHRGAGALSLLALCSAVPLVAAVPLFGAVADRYEPRWVMLAANVVRGATIAGVALSDDLAVMCALSGSAALAGGCFNAAEQRFIRYRVADGLLLQANSLRSTTERLLTGMAGPAIAAVLITTVGARPTLWITAGGFAISALLVVLVGAVGTTGGDDRDRDVPEQTRGRMAAGLRHVWAHPPLRLTVVAMALAYVFSMMFDVMLPIWYREMGGGPGFVGAAMMCMGLGGAAGAILLARIGDRYNLMSLMAVSALVVGVLVGLMGLAGLAGRRDLLGIWLACAAFIGVASAVAIIGYTTLVQRLTPPALMGRVAAVSGAALTAPTVVGPALAPGVSALLGVAGLFTACGAGLVLLGLVVTWRARTYDLAPLSTNIQAPATVR